MSTFQSLSSLPLISIVIPTRNEAEDISETLQNCLALDYPKKEIIVVDDSTDETPYIIQQFVKYGVRLLHREGNRNGCCGARSLGMQSATGKIIVLFNADDRPASDFLRKVLLHYQNGADYVVVQSAVKNQSRMLGKFMRAYEQFIDEWINPDPEWSEGFSCKKDAAESVGYFPGDFPIPFCRDYMLGKKLRDVGYHKKVDYEICVQHIVPDTFRGFWRNRLWRGTFSAPNSFYFHKRSVIFIFLRETAKGVRTLLKYGFIIPGLITAFRVAKHMDKAWKYVVPFFIICLIQDLALNVGNFKGFSNLMKVEGWMSS